MSAFVVTDKTINQVVSYLCDDRAAKWWFWPRVAEVLEIAPQHLTAEWMATDDGLSYLGAEMRLLNVDSVRQRYSAAERKGMIPARPYCYQYELCDRFQALKSLACWLYQSCEGTCHTEPLYELMEELKYEWAMAIVNDLPEYERAEWDAS